MPIESTVFVDTNVLLYAQDPRSPAKQGHAAQWLAWCWSGQRGRISSQVLNEVYVNLRKVAPTLSAQQARDVVRRYRNWKPWLVDDATVDHAWVLQDETAYSYWDCLMLASALHQGCRYLLTEDLQHGRKVDNLTIISPFVVLPQDLGMIE
ncbi:MAG: PIN domain-containing protein [Burkholderiales bacterium]|nr:PIN domain-containing protein [Burkholderiales bacterium]